VKTLKAIVKRNVGNCQRGCGYVYHDGIDYYCEEFYKKQRINVNYRADYEVRMSSEIERLVLHNESLLILGEIDRVSFYADNSSEHDKARGVEKRGVWIYWKSGVNLCFDESRNAGNRYWQNSDVTIQLKDEVAKCDRFTEYESIEVAA